MRLILFLALAARQFFFEIAKPSRGTPNRAALPSLLRHSTVNTLSLLRLAFLKTRPYAAASSSRFSLRKRYGELLTNKGCLSAAEIAYGVSLARPFARRRFNTRRPAFVAMRARKPWVRARLIVLG